MLPMYRKWPDRLVIVPFLACLRANAALLGDVLFFERGIDYWHQGSTSRGSTVPSQSRSTGNSSSAASSAFPWAKYMDPTNKEFFREGDYVPPEPFMEVVRDPSDSNLKLWLAYIDKKNQLATRMQARLQEYLGTSQAGALPPAPIQPATDLAMVRRYRFRMYFDSQCPHCKRMFGTLAELQKQGFLVEAKQIDDRKVDLSGIPFVVERATPQEVRKKDIQNVPLLLVGDLQKKAVYRMEGYHTLQEVLLSLSRRGV